MALSVRDKKITVPLSKEGMKDAADWLMRYKKKMLNNIDKLLTMMLRKGEQYAIMNCNHVRTGMTISTIIGYRDGNHGIILAGGNAIWIEFGTGVHVPGQFDHPVLEDVVGKTSVVRHGEYDKKHGADEKGWFYQDEFGEWHHTYGQVADPFFYETAQMLRKEYATYAKEIFKK